MATLPYVTAPGNIEKALTAMKSAATPPKVTQDFVKNILKIPGGSGDQITSFLKKIGFTNADGTPSKLYNSFRNSSSSGMAAAEALKIGYAPLYKRNEYMHTLDNKGLTGLVLEETGQGEDSNVPSLITRSITAIKKFCDFNMVDEEPKEDQPPQNNMPMLPPVARGEGKKLGMNLSYTINLNLPATSDIAVFNAIFKSLKENLLRGIDEV